MPKVTTFLDLLGGNVPNFGSSNQSQLNDNSSICAYITWKHSDGTSSLKHLGDPRKLKSGAISTIEEYSKKRPIKNISATLIGNTLPIQIGLKETSIQNKPNSNLNYHVTDDNYFNILLKSESSGSLLKNISSNEEELTLNQFQKDLSYDDIIEKYRCKSDSVTGLAISVAGNLNSKLEKATISGTDVEVYFITEEMKKVMQTQVEDKNKNIVDNFENQIEIGSLAGLEFVLVPLIDEDFAQTSKKSTVIANQKIIMDKSDQKIDHTVTLQLEFFY